jgi:ribosomal protein L7/L12
MPGDYEVMELRAHVLELEGKIDFLFKHFDLQYVKVMSEADQKVADMLKKGNMIEAIKVYRELYNVDLGSAKRLVEEMKSRLNL